MPAFFQYRMFLVAFLDKLGIPSINVNTLESVK